VRRERRTGRVVRVLSSVTALATAALTVVLPTPSAHAAAAADAVTMTVTGVDPVTPTASSAEIPLHIGIHLVNRSATAYPNVRILAERGDPIGNQQALDSAIRNPSPPTVSGKDIPATDPVTVSLAAHGSADVVFSTTTSIIDQANLCVCGNQVDPVFLSAHVTGSGGVDQRLGATSTFVPVVDKPLPDVQVGWVWPLLERPHRLNGDTVFQDDDLATAVADGGRLDRSLQVVEQVAGTGLPLTVVLDPETVDELEVMSTEAYTIGSGKTATPGTGAQVAQAWLGRLQTVLSTHPLIRVELTPYGDPDVQSLTEHSRRVNTQLPTRMAARVAAALGGVPTSTDLAWPATGRISAATLAALGATGVDSVLLSSAAVSTGATADSVPPGLARLSSDGSDVAALLTDSRTQSLVSSAVSSGGSAQAALPRLVSQLAVRAFQQPTQPHLAVLTPPRYVDPSVEDAVETIEHTSTSPCTEPVDLRTAVSGSLLPTGRSALAKLPASTVRLPDSTFAAVDAVRSSAATIKSLLGADTTDVKTLLGDLPIAVQRTESSAWLAVAGGSPSTGAHYADQLSGLISGLTSGVHIVLPSTGAYTLASSNSKLPVTVENDGVPGFSSPDIGTQAVPADSKVTVHLPTKLDRSGRIRVEASLRAPDGTRIGDSAFLSIHSTALGTIGVIITVVAGALLALALVLRAGRSLLRRRRRRTAAPGTTAGAVGG
jgi:hypothetical protein